MKKAEIAKRRSYYCGGVDGADICHDALICQRCGYCLIHCMCAGDARVQPDVETLQGEQITLCERPQLAWMQRKEPAWDFLRVAAMGPK